jgi:hypothetical protein
MPVNPDPLGAGQDRLPLLDLSNSAWLAAEILVEQYLVHLY